MLLVIGLTLFALALARAMRAPAGTWRWILGVAATALVASQVLPEGNAFRQDVAGSATTLFWIGLGLAPVAAYAVLVRALRRRIGTDMALAGARAGSGLRGLVRIDADAALAAETSAALRAEAPGAGRSFGWRDADGTMAGHLRLVLRGDLAEIEMLRVASRAPSRRDRVRAARRRRGRGARHGRRADRRAGRGLADAGPAGGGRLPARRRAGAGRGTGSAVDGEDVVSAMEPEELERYARHIVLREVGGPGQRRLRDARVLVVGAGGLGCPALTYLAAAGVGALGVVDDDVVSLSNLQRQPLFATGDVGQPKVRCAEAALGRLNPHVAVEAHPARLGPENAAGIVGGYDLVLDGTDNFATRYLVNRASVAAGRPLVAAAMSQWEGQISLWDPARGGPCFQCVFPEAPAEGLAPSCAEAGIVGALPGVMGSLMALEAIKAITRAGEGLRGRLLIFDALYGDTRRIAVRARAECPVCRGIGA